MGSIDRHPRAEADLDDIWYYIAEESTPEQASRFLRQLEKDFALLSDWPMMGQAREEYATGLRSWPRNDYLIFYQPVEGGIILLRILHARRDIRRADF